MDYMNRGTRPGEKLFIQPALQALVIYDDPGCAAEARALLMQAAMRADAALGWDVKPWRMDLLEQPALSEMARGEAVGADVIVLSVSKTRAPTRKLMAWLENWALQRQVQDAALVLLAGGRTAAMSFAARIKQFAAWHRLTALYRVGAEPGARLRKSTWPARGVQFDVARSGSWD